MTDNIKKNNQRMSTDALKNTMTPSETSAISTGSLQDTLADNLINHASVNDLIPVQKIQAGLKQAGAVQGAIQSHLASADNLSLNALTENELIQSTLPTANIDRLKNTQFTDPLANITTLSKSEFIQQMKDDLLSRVAKTGLYFMVQVGELSVSTFDVVEFKLEEALSELFTLTLTLSSRDAEINLQQQLLQKVIFDVYSNGKKQRTVHGIIEKAKRGDSGFKRTYYTLVVRPLLWQLTLTKDSRIYHFKSVPDIIDEILRDFNIVFDKQMMDPHVVREYTTMKRESYYEFISRLAAEEGMAFWFEETMMFYSDSHLGMTGGPALIYNPHPQAATRELVINTLSFECAMRPTKTKTKDYRYSHPDVLMDARAETRNPQPNFTVYDSYGRYYDEKTAQQFSQYRLEALRSDSELGQATSNSIQLMPGKIFGISEHPTQSINRRWQVIRITHQGTLPQSLGNESDDSPANLTNELSFIPGEHDWRPAFTHKPQADGDEMATVVGPKGEEIYVNEDGAVKVAFHWNAYDAKDENASCWVRVMQNWNGNGYGFLATPRIGQEVIIAYLNGDLDRPIITGTVYNGSNRPPLNLPAEKTRMSIKSKTHKGDGFNELRFEDENGKQQVFIQAEKDFDQLTKHNHVVQVDNNAHLQVNNEYSETVKSHRYIKIEGEAHHTIQLDRKTQILGNDYKKVAASEHSLVGIIQTVEAGQEIHLKAGMNIVINGGLSLTLKAGGQHLILDPSGIWSTTPIRLGGVLQEGTSSAPLPPMAKQYGMTGRTLKATPLKPAEASAPVDVIKKLKLIVRPLPHLPGYRNEPYELYVDGAMKQKGLTDEEGAVITNYIPDARQYEVKLINGHSFTINLADTAEQIAETDFAGIQGYRSFEHDKHDQDSSENKDDYRLKAKDSNGCKA